MQGVPACAPAGLPHACIQLPHTAFDLLLTLLLLPSPQHTGTLASSTGITKALAAPN